MLPINLLIIIYLIAISICIAISPHPRSIFLLILNGIIILFLSVISFNIINYQTIYTWLGLLFLPLFYHEIGFATQTNNRKTLDPAFIEFEKKYFAKVMSFHQNNSASQVFLSEYLHACYLSFYIFIYGVPLYLYLQHNIIFFYECTFAILLTLLLGYITHIIVPVHGPRTIFPKIIDKRSQGCFFKIVHHVLSKGSTPGTAFPSGHTSSACIALFMTWHLNMPLFYILLPIGIGLIISTIYGRFHYVADVIIGIAYAIIAFLITISIYD